MMIDVRDNEKKGEYRLPYLARMMKNGELVIVFQGAEGASRNVLDLERGIVSLVPLDNIIPLGPGSTITLMQEKLP